MTPTRPVITDISQLDLSQSYTYADYLSWKFSEYVELIRGKIFRKMSAPVSAHQIISGNLSGELYVHLKRKQCRAFAAPFDVRLLRSSGNGDAQIRTVVQPDLCVVCDPAKIDARGCLGAPDWIIEIILPSTACLDTATKFDLYAENDVTEYWLVFPLDKIIQAFVRSEQGEYVLVNSYEQSGPIPSHTLSELTLEWADIFDGVD
ncbi:Uma2 family endonuclease [Hymenobacter sp. H14-R3]|uniref:Uma2 family endonuclease n=1 Tax=Hymenobacter sp. H14-R3 TaxID=3046308 RepID=UPI0024B8BC26|nr:Uma2 family endonuclease [Hymenobacter sp. H14-R3]MDJ0364180.1 Uma2 family endonuclease [Hymenobacter sp. H14-R3]